jgi:dihydrofolate reductase
MKAIIACDSQGGIGYKNQLPWNRISGDLPRFKALTKGNTVLMGRNTWESLPFKPLAGRINFVVSSQHLDLPPGAFQVSNIDPFVSVDNVWVIGGAQLIKTAWSHLHEIHLTKTFSKYTCDTFIDLLQLNKDFTIDQSREHEDHFYIIYKRK